MKKILFSFIFILFTCNLISAQATNNNTEGVLFKFDQRKGNSTSHVAEVMEEAYLNGILINRTRFINRLTTTIIEELEDGDAKLETNYMITQNNFLNNIPKSISWGEEDTVRISRKSNGQLFDSDNEELPTVRGVPSFPDKPVKIGETWEMPGEEVHDCRDLFEMTELIRVPFTATYQYVGDENQDGKLLNIIEVYYEFSQANRRNQLYRNGFFSAIQGNAAQRIYWDNARNDLDYYEENFEIELFDIFGNSYFFRGASNGNVTEYKSVNDDNHLQQIQNTVAEYNLENVSVSKGDKGLTISIENIQFEPDSDVLRPSEIEKLSKIGEILKTVTNDLLITGHCARRGSVESQQSLSESRAESVASFMMQSGIRDKYHIFTQGKGATEPIASNDTEDGRSKNRRVEITIMD